MWEFLLALGQVPGTNFQITFTEILWAVYLLLVLWLYRKKIFPKKSALKNLVYLGRHFDLFLLTKRGSQLRLRF